MEKITKLVVLLLALTGTWILSARTIESFNEDWEFAREGTAFTKVSLPHDWAIEGPFDPDGNGNTGKLPWKGAGTYRKVLMLKEKPCGRVFLDFDGVMANALVLINGNPCARGEYGYLGFRADATAYLLIGTNTIEVRCDTLKHKSRWYSGAGIYRKVSLVQTDDVYVEDDSLRVSTEDVLTGKAKVTIEGEIVSRRLASAPATITATILDPRGKTAAEAQGEVTVDGFGSAKFKLVVMVKDPELWEMRGNAALYSLSVALKGQDFSDQLVRRIGFREFRFDPDNGFFLNGNRVQLKGVNLHADLGPLGMAFDKDAMRRQLSIMRDMGANALRTSHNCPAPEVLDLCDEMGIFVWDECFDKWNDTCGRGEVPLEEFVPRVLKRWVRRDRLHPSVFCWSIGNEISPNLVTPPGQEEWRSVFNVCTSVERCARFRNAIREEDVTRPVASGSCFTLSGTRGDFDPLDLTGWNYEAKYEVVKKARLNTPVIYSESASALSDYGYYAAKLPKDKTDYAKAVRKVDSYDLNAAAWSDIPDREFVRMERDRYCAGEFVWTGIDYLGEPTPYAQSKIAAENARSSYFGICDLCVMPKDRFYLYRSYWNREAFTLHIVPSHWNFPEKAGERMPVMVYTSADSAELFLNGKSLGIRRKNPSAGSLDDYYSVLPRYRLIWDEVVYAPGELKAVAYGADGAVLGEAVVRTAGAPVKVVLTPERKYGSLCVVKVSLADKDGNFVPNDHRRISFAVEGGEILAVGNADPFGMDSFKRVDSHPLYFGRAAVYVRCGEGEVVLKAFADGLDSSVICK